MKQKPMYYFILMSSIFKHYTFFIDLFYFILVNLGCVVSYTNKDKKQS